MQLTVCLQSHESWKRVFLLAATVHFFGVTFYAIYASGELQPWAEPPDTDKKPWDPLEGAKAQWPPAESKIASPPDKGVKCSYMKNTICIKIIAL